MVSPTELDLFNRCLGGDRRARTELYKKFVYGSSRVRRMGAACSDIDEFLHDCFGNLLRTGHSWHGEQSLARWVESVAVWTAIVNARQRDLHTRGAQGEIRMCAEIEGEDIVHSELLPAYAPPLSGPGDSPAARVLALLSGDEQTVFLKRAMENSTWEQTASASGKPLNAVGQIFARVTARIARLFGAPPPMDDDLIPVFSRVFADPQKPEGRAISVQLDISFYSLTPEMHAIGLKTAYEARILALWDAARGPDTSGDALLAHLDQCHYCAEMLSALRLMRQALSSSPGAEFRLCPGAFTLAQASEQAREAFEQHLTLCSLCQQERSQLLDGQAPRQGAETGNEEIAAGAGKKIAWTVAAILVLGVGSLAGYHFLTPHKADAAAAPLASDAPLNTVSVEPRYRDLVQNVPLDDARVLSMVLPANRPMIKFALDQFSLGETGPALMVSAQVAKKGDDPGAQTVYAMSLFRVLLMTDAYREMLKAEAMAPRDPLRCWIMLQFSLVTGDKPVIAREVQHLSADPQYKERAASILERVRQRG